MKTYLGFLEKVLLGDLSRGVQVRASVLFGHHYLPLKGTSENWQRVMTKLWRVHVNDEAAVSMINKWKHEHHKAKQQATPPPPNVLGGGTVFVIYNITRPSFPGCSLHSGRCEKISADWKALCLPTNPARSRPWQHWSPMNSIYHKKRLSGRRSLCRILLVRTYWMRTPMLARFGRG